MGHQAGSRSGKRGMALVLVMMVVLALAIIATPFVLSMILQERTGTMTRYASQADYGSQGVRDYATWRLMYGVDHLERRLAAGQFSTWLYDTREEFDIRLDDATLTQGADILDPEGAIWGLIVQDESGKIDVRTAPRDLIARIRDMIDGKIVDRKDYLTMYAGRDATWIYPQRIRAIDGQGNAICRPVGTTGVGAENVWFFGKGSRVRATKPGAPPFTAEVTAHGLTDSFGRAFQTNPPIPGSYLDGVVEVEQRHPVNVNTAKVETLAALFAGLHLHNIPDSVVDGGAAAEVARLFAGRRTERIEDFIQKLQSASLSGTQRLAIAINAIAPTFWWLDGSGTMPLCFTSYDSYTIEAFASQNNPAGATMASRGFREIVSVSPPELLTRFCESQYDFDRMLSARASLQDARMMGFPYGWRMVSFPNLIPVPPLPTQYVQQPAPSDIRLKPQQSPGQPGGEAYVQMATGLDYRGWWNLERNLEWPGTWSREHFNDTQEGKRLNGAAHTYPWIRVFAQDQSYRDFKDMQEPRRRSNATGGMEMWVRFDGVSNPDQLFDIREQDFMNRIGLRVENGELIYQASDSTIGVQGNLIDDGAALVRMPFSPNTGDWYHFGAYWKGTGLGELALLVDGFAHPQQTFEYVNPEGQRLDSELTGALSQTSTSIAMKDDSWVPTGQIVALQVGAEVMLYDKSAGTLLRGARRTQAVQHPAGATVRPFGYSSKIRDGQVLWQGPQVTCPYNLLKTGGAKSIYRFGGNPALPQRNPEVRSEGTQQDPMTMLWFIDAMETDIPVNEGVYTIMDFPDKGYIRIENEVIYYDDRMAGDVNGRGTAKFTGCVRGQQGTTAVQHFANQRVLLWSVAVDDFTNYLDPTIILVDDEFIGPVQKDQSRPNFFIPPWQHSRNGSYPNLMRGVLGTLSRVHNPQEVVSPTFLASDIDVPGRMSMGGDDYVTLTDSSNLKERAQVRMTGPPFPNYQWPGGLRPSTGAGQTQLVGLYQPTAREYAAADVDSRALKFPSGELLGLNFLRTNPQFSIGPLNATIDEVKFMADRFARAVPTVELSKTDQTVSLTGTGRYPDYGGLIKIGNEYMGYMQVSGQDLTNVKRGWLGSAAEVHDAGDPVFNLYWVPVTTLQSDLTPTDPVVYLNEPLRGRTDQYQKGYVLIDDELLLFEWNNHERNSPDSGKELKMPARWDGTTGLYRGMFGTQPASHSAADALVYGIPWRFWDTYKAREFDNTMAYMQWSTRMEEARWDTLRFESEIPQGDSNIVLHALVLLDGKGGFWDPPGFTEKSLLLEFVNGSGGKINRVGYQNDAGQLDVRFYTEYKQGSFDPLQPWAAHSWKRTPKIKQIQVDYDRPTRTLYHEDK